MTKKKTRSENAAAPKPEQRVKLVHAGDVPLLYTNRIKIRATEVDATFDLGFVIEDTEEELTVQALARVVMSPPLLREFCDRVNSLVREYEQRFGPLPPRTVPPEREA